MRSLASDISDGCNHGIGQFTLDAQAPLLRVGPDRFRGYAGYVERVCAWPHGAGRLRTADASVIPRKSLRHAKHEWSASFQRPGVGFLGRAMLVEHAVAGADGGLAVAARIESKANARCSVEELSRHAAVG